MRACSPLRRLAESVSEVGIDSEAVRDGAQVVEEPVDVDPPGPDRPES